MTEVDITKGTIIHGRYRLLERIGGGGMGHVFRADDTKTGRTVAIKLLHKELWGSPDVTASLFQEAKVLSSVRHPNIVEILDADTSEHGPFIAMEHLAGSSAGVLVAIMGRFDEATTIAIAIPVLAALEAAHRSGVIHRDLKPENVFVCRERSGRGERGTVHLLDFGIAKLESPSAGEAPRTRTGVVFGTPDYLSPEQATGEGVLDGRSDLFSLGIVMFELLTGRRPFTASTAVATAFRIVHASAPSFDSLGIAISTEVRAIVRNLLSKQPQDRPASATEVLRVLSSLDPGEDARHARLMRLLSDADERKRRTTRPPPPSSSRGAPTSRGPILPAIGLDLAHVQVPTRALGRCARGSVLRSLDAVIEVTYGELERERVVALLSDVHAEELRRGRPNALEAHDVELVRRYVDIASRVLVIDVVGFFHLGRKSVDGELMPFVGTLVKPADFGDLLRRAVAILRCFFDFGAWTIDSEGRDVAALRIDEFELVPPLLRSWFLGVVQRIFEHAISSEARVIDATPPGSPVSLFVMEILAPQVSSGR